MLKKAALWFAFIILSGCCACAKNPNGAFDGLMRRLIAEGRDSTQLARLFQDDRVEIISRIIPLNLVSREVPEAYRGFLADDQVHEGFSFLNTKLEELEHQLNGTGISPEIAVAMLKVESDLGRKSGNYPIFTVFATLAVMDNPTYWRQIADTSAPSNFNALCKRAQKRARWAYRELNHFLDLCAAQGWDPLGIKGSWAGAFGWAQFLPSSYQRCARDGDGDGSVNLFSLPDAVASMSYYLKEAGWSNNPKSQYQALLSYNPSSAYANCILEYAKKLSKLEKSEAQSAQSERE